MHGKRRRLARDLAQPRLLHHTNRQPEDELLAVAHHVPRVRSPPRALVQRHDARQRIARRVRPRRRRVPHADVGHHVAAPRGVRHQAAHQMPTVALRRPRSIVRPARRVAAAARRRLRGQKFSQRSRRHIVAAVPQRPQRLDPVRRPALREIEFPEVILRDLPEIVFLGHLRQRHLVRHLDLRRVGAARLEVEFVTHPHEDRPLGHQPHPQRSDRAIRQPPPRSHEITRRPAPESQDGSRKRVRRHGRRKFLLPLARHPHGQQSVAQHERVTLRRRPHLGRPVVFATTSRTVQRRVPSAGRSVTNANVASAEPSTPDSICAGTTTPSSPTTRSASAPAAGRCNAPRPPGSRAPCGR